MTTHKTVHGSIHFLLTQKTLTTNGNNTQIKSFNKSVNLAKPVRGECPRSGCIESMNGKSAASYLHSYVPCSTLDAATAPLINKQPTMLTIGGP